MRGSEEGEEKHLVVVSSGQHSSPIRKGNRLTDSGQTSLSDSQIVARPLSLALSHTPVFYSSFFLFG